MTETAVSFKAGKLLLEGLLQRLPGGRGVVVTHPHPLYGGDMYNPVVNAIARVYNECGFSSLCFNFRGTGRSQGTFANGEGEREDVAAALQYLLSCGFEHLHVAGYSFGARVLAGLRGLPAEVKAQVHVAPPVALMDYGGIGRIDKLRMVVAGAMDDIAPPRQIAARLGQWNGGARLVVLDGADHFFSTGLAGLRAALRDNLVEEHASGPQGGEA